MEFSEGLAFPAGSDNCTSAFPVMHISLQTSHETAAPKFPVNPSGNSFGGVTWAISNTEPSYPNNVIFPGTTNLLGAGNCTAPTVNPGGMENKTRVAIPDSPGFFQ